MRRYTILNITRTIGERSHIYAAQRAAGGDLTGNYICTTLENDTKIVTDFLCMSNSAVTSVKDNGRNLIFTIGENTQHGTITKFEPNLNNMNVYFDNTRTNPMLITTVQKRQTAARPAATAPTAGVSRSTQEKNPFAVLEAKIVASENGRQLRLEKYLKKNLPATLELFLIEFFKEYNEERNTIFTDDKSVQTDTGRRRSLGDIYKISKYYYPDCTLIDVLRLLYNVIPTKIRNGFRTSYCSTIRKRVWYFSSGEDNGIFNTNQPDEYGNITTFYTSKL